MPAKQATALKIMRGTAQPCRMNPAEPKPPRGIPDAPAHLSDLAKETWPAVAGILDAMGVLTRADALAVEGLCECYAELRAARKRLADHGQTTYDATGKDGKRMWRNYPEVSQVADLDRRFRGWLAVFGLTPADRSRVSAEIEDKRDAWTEL